MIDQQLHYGILLKIPDTHIQVDEERDAKGLVEKT
jgi:hypothetical protein